MKKNKPLALLLALALLAGLLTLPAAAGEGAPSPADRAQAAAGLAMQYGGADSVQYALWRDGEIVLSGHAGSYSRTENRALTADNLYGIGSVSKIYTTVAAMQLAEAGKLDLDKPVTAYLPGFTMADERYRQITVRMLLNHSSGLMGSSTANAFLLGDPEDTSGTDDLLNRLSTQRLKADPGAYSVYCNDGFTLAELVVEAVSGQDFSDYLHDRILGPNGLDGTFTPADGFDRALMAKTYLGQSDSALPPETLGVVGTGGIYATAEDLASFGGLFCGTGLLRQSSLDAMASDESARGLWPADSEDDALAYGLGWDNVRMFPFNQSGIQALVKGGDTLAYHAALVVLPEYDLSVALLTSGGSSAYNQLAAARILIDTLSEQGVTVDETAALPAAQSADMPAGMDQYAGVYAGTAGIMTASFDENGLTLTLPEVLGGGGQTLGYYSDGSFRDEAGTTRARLVTEENGNTYLWEQIYQPVQGLAPTVVSEYTMQRLEDNEVSGAVMDAWRAREDKSYVLVNEKYSSGVYPIALSAAGFPAGILDIAPGYVSANRIVDENTALACLQIPGTAGRDQTDYRFYTEGGAEYLEAGTSLFVDAETITNLYAGPGAYCTVGEQGYARWFAVGGAAGKTLSVEVPDQGAFYVYDQTGAATAGSWAFGDTSATLPEGGYVVFVGQPGARFHLSAQAAPAQPEAPTQQAAPALPGQYDSMAGLMEAVNASHRAVLKPDVDFTSYLHSFSGDDFNIFDYQSTDVEYAPGAALTLAQAEADLDVLFRALQTTYGPYYAFGGDEAFGAAKAAVLQDCKDASALTAGVLEQSLLKHLAFMKDGHFTVNGTGLSEVQVDNSYSKVAYLRDGQGYYTQDGGRRVASVDGYADLDGLFRLSASTGGQVVYYPGVLTDFKATPGELTVRYTDGTADVLSADRWSSGYEQSERTVDLQYSGDIPVLFARNMGFDEANGDTTGKEFLSYAEQLRDEPVVILDLRSNGGGNGFLPLKWLAAWTGSPVTSNYRELMYLSMEDLLSDSPENPYYTSPEDWKNIADAAALDDHYVEANRQPDAFVDSDSLLIILTGKNTASAAEIFVDAARNVENTLIIGQNTYGMLTSNAYTVMYLPNSGVAVQLGCNLCVFPEGDFEEFVGYQPELWTSADALDVALNLVQNLK